MKTRAKKVFVKENRAAKLNDGAVSTPATEEKSSAIASIIPSQIDSLENTLDDDKYE